MNENPGNMRSPGEESSAEGRKRLSEFTPQDWAAIEAAQEADKMRRLAELPDLVRATPVAEPLRSELAWLSERDFEAVTRDHPGRRIEDRFRSLKAALYVFESALADLLGTLDKFDTLTQEPSALTRARSTELDAVVRAIRKEIFCASAAAYALVEHCRRFLRVSGIGGVDARRAEIFDQNENAFVLGLRKNLQHLHFAEADWVVRWGTSNSRSSHFELSVERLLTSQDTEFTVEARAFMAQCGDTIDIRSVFVSYGRCVAAFYAWLEQAYEAAQPPAVGDYRAVVRTRRATQARAMWRVALLQLAKPGVTDPYAHLPKFLSPAEIEEVRRLPDHSQGQVDRIIALVDRDGACDGELRERLYRLFGVPETAPD